MAGHVGHVPIISDGHCRTGGWAAETSRSPGALRKAGLSLYILRGNWDSRKKEDSGVRVRDAENIRETDRPRDLGKPEVDPIPTHLGSCRVWPC